MTSPLTRFILKMMETDKAALARANTDKLADRHGISREHAAGYIALWVGRVQTPVPCSDCQGRGVTYRYRRDDRRYPVKCTRCGGSGINADHARTNLRMEE